MTITGYTVTATTQRWRLHAGEWRREVHAIRHSDGAARVLLVRDAA